MPNVGLTVGGTVTGTNLTSTSDERLKENIIDFADASAKLRQMRAVNFNFKEGDKRTRLGFIAQQLEAFMPEVVFTDDKGFKSVDYGNISAALVGGWQDHDNRIAKLESYDPRIAALEARIAQLEARAA